MAETRPCTRLESRACAMRDGMAVIKPNFVVTRASEIPRANSLFSGLAKFVICLKTTLRGVVQIFH